MRRDPRVMPAPAPEPVRTGTREFLLDTTPQQQLCLRRHDAPEPAAHLAPDPGIADLEVPLPVALHTPVRDTLEQLVRRRPMDADGLQARRALIGTHPLDHAWTASHGRHTVLTGPSLRMRRIRLTA